MRIKKTNKQHLPKHTDGRIDRCKTIDEMKNQIYDAIPILLII